MRNLRSIGQSIGQSIGAGIGATDGIQKMEGVGNAHKKAHGMLKDVQVSSALNDC